MPISKSMSTIQELLSIWDKGNVVARSQILDGFLKQNSGKTKPELEQEFGYVGSLFLNRLTAWLRLTYMMGSCVGQQLRAIQVFISAANGHQYMTEFIEVGGILTLLEIVGLKQSKEEDKADALMLLCSIASAGRQYKELVCESYGIRAVAECLAKSTCEDTMEQAKLLLMLLAQGNPKYESQVYKGLIALLPSTSPKAQQMALQNLRIVQTIVKKANPSLVEPLLNLLSSNHLEVQYEVIEYARELMDYDVKEQLITGLVKSLHPSREDVHRTKHNITSLSQANRDLSTPLPAFIKQASAAKAIGILSRDSSDHAKIFLNMQAVQHLLYTMGNVDYADSQKQASLTLEYFVRIFPDINESVKRAMGEELYDFFMNDPENLYVNLSAVQADVLVSNKIHTTV